MSRSNVSSPPHRPQRRGVPRPPITIPAVVLPLLILSALPWATATAQEPPPPPRAPSAAWFGVAPQQAVLGLQFGDADNTDLHRDGVVLSGVMPESSADEAGLEAGDVIVRLDGTDLTRPLPDGEERVDDTLAPAVARLLFLARELRPGQEVELDVVTEGEERRVRLTARRPDRGRIATARLFGPEGPLAGLDTIRVWPPRGEGEWFRFRGPRGEPPRPPELREHLRHRLEGFGLAPARFGLRLFDLNEGLARYFGRSEGALVLEVHEDAPLELEAGDVIVSIGERTVEDAGHASRILGSYRAGESVSVEVWREGRNVRVRGEAP